MWINVKGLIAWEDAAVPVELFTERERSVQAIHPLIGMISYCEILKIHVLEKKQKKNHDFFMMILKDVQQKQISSSCLRKWIIIVMEIKMLFTLSMA